MPPVYKFTGAIYCILFVVAVKCYFFIIVYYCSENLVKLVIRLYYLKGIKIRRCFQFVEDPPLLVSAT